MLDYKLDNHIQSKINRFLSSDKSKLLINGLQSIDIIKLKQEYPLLEIKEIGISPDKYGNQKIMCRITKH